MFSFKLWTDQIICINKTSFISCRIITITTIKKANIIPRLKGLLPTIKHITINFFYVKKFCFLLLFPSIISLCMAKCSALKALWFFFEIVIFFQSFGILCLLKIFNNVSYCTVISSSVSLNSYILITTWWYIFKIIGSHIDLGLKRTFNWLSTMTYLLISFQWSHQVWLLKEEIPNDQQQPQ